MPNIFQSSLYYFYYAPNALHILKASYIFKVYAANAAIDDWHTLPDISCFSSNSSDMMDVEDPLLAPQPGAFEGDGGEQDDSGGMFL